MFSRCGSPLWVAGESVWAPKICGGSPLWFPAVVPRGGAPSSVTKSFTMLHGRLRELRGAKRCSGGGSAKFPGNHKGTTTANHNGETQREMRNVMFMKLRVEKVSVCILERPTECFQCVFILKGKSSIFQNNLNYMGNLQGYFSKLLRSMRFLCIYSVHSWFQNT